ncbi:MAG TPA: hypothetical protein VFG29_14410 [Syntrophales bacterium]|nr:hypothetical protein [Syntrophales bacterium]
MFDKNFLFWGIERGGLVKNGAPVGTGALEEIICRIFLEGQLIIDDDAAEKVLSDKGQREDGFIKERTLYP